MELGTQLSMVRFTESEAYLEVSAPMPVGSTLVVTAADDVQVEVVVRRVYEQLTGAEREAGMIVRPSALEGAAKIWWNNQIIEASEGASAPSDTIEMETVSPDVAAAEEKTAAAVSADPEPVAASAEAEAEAEAPPEAAEKPTKKARKKRRRRK